MADFSQMSAAERAAAIQDFVNQTYASGGNNAAIAAAMDQYGVSPQELAAAVNADVGEVQAEYNRLAPSGAYASQPSSGGIASLPANPANNTIVSQPGGNVQTPSNVTGGIVQNVANVAAATPDFSQMSPAQRAQTIQDFTNQTIAAYGNDTEGARRALAQAMDQYGVNVQEFANATGNSVADVQSEYNRLNPSGQFFQQSTGNLGITGLNQAATNLNTTATNTASTPDFSQMSPADRAKTIQDFTNQTIAAYGNDTDGARRALAQAMDQYGVNVQEFASATGMNPTDVQSEYNRLNPSGKYFTQVTTLPDIKLAPPVTGEGISTQFIREAPEIEAYKLGIMQEAKRLYEQPVNYKEEGLEYKVADPSAMTQGSYDIAQQGIGTYQPFIQQGASTLAQGQGLAQQAATMGQLGLGAYLSATGQYNPQQAAQFMNPYQQLVTDQALREIRRQADIAGQTQAAQAVRTGAFGGTREGVQRAEMERNTQDIMSQRIAQDLAQNYAQAQQAAQGAYEAQQQRAIAAGQGIGGLTGTYGSLGSQLGQLGVQQAALGQAAQQGLTSDVNMLNVLGQQQQAQSQAELEAARMSNYQRVFDPYTRLGFVSDIYKGAPSSQSTVAATSSAQPSMFQQLVGGVTSGIATAAGAQKLGLF